MTPPTLCPACLTELPTDYPHDHVAIDAALDRSPELFKRMSRDERTEVVVTGLSRGMSLHFLAQRFGWADRTVRLLLPAGHPVLAVDDRAFFEATVRELWERDLPDTAIAMQAGCSPNAVSNARSRLRLPSKFGPGGRRKRVTA